MTSFLKSIELHQPHLDEKITWVRAIHAWQWQAGDLNRYRPETLHTTWCRGPGHQQIMYQWSAQALDLVICWGPAVICEVFITSYILFSLFLCNKLLASWIGCTHAHLPYSKLAWSSSRSPSCVEMVSSCLNSKTRPIATQEGGSLATYSHRHSLMSLSPHARVVSFEQLIKGTNSTSPCTHPHVFLLAFLETKPCPTLETIKGSRYSTCPAYFSHPVCAKNSLGTRPSVLRAVLHCSS